jgi:hypothetical protein
VGLSIEHRAALFIKAARVADEIVGALSMVAPSVFERVFTLMPVRPPADVQRSTIRQPLSRRATSLSPSFRPGTGSNTSRLPTRKSKPRHGKASVAQGGGGDEDDSAASGSTVSRAAAAAPTPATTVAMVILAKSRRI